MLRERETYRGTKSQTLPVYRLVQETPVPHFIKTWRQHAKYRTEILAKPQFASFTENSCIKSHRAMQQQCCFTSWQRMYKCDSATWINGWCFRTIFITTNFLGLTCLVYTILYCLVLSRVLSCVLMQRVPRTANQNVPPVVLVRVTHGVPMATNWPVTSLAHVRCAIVHQNKSPANSATKYTCL